MSANVSQDDVGLNDTSAHDAADAKGVIPTFEEFLEYILSTDLQGELLFGAPTFFRLTMFQRSLAVETKIHTDFQ